MPFLINSDFLLSTTSILHIGCFLSDKSTPLERFGCHTTSSTSRPSLLLLHAGG